MRVSGVPMPYSRRSARTRERMLARVRSWRRWNLRGRGRSMRASSMCGRHARSPPRRIVHESPEQFRSPTGCTPRIARSYAAACHHGDGRVRVRETIRGARSAFAVFAAAVVAMSAFAGQPAIEPVEPARAGTADPALVARGAALAALGNCTSCHTTADGVPFAGGVPLVTPLGTIYGTNITPAPRTGIGRWPEAAFVRAMRDGVSRDGHLLYPAFPYDHFRAASDDELHALYAFLDDARRVRVDAAGEPSRVPARLAAAARGVERAVPARPGATFVVDERRRARRPSRRRARPLRRVPHAAQCAAGGEARRTARRRDGRRLVRAAAERRHAVAGRLDRRRDDAATCGPGSHRTTRWRAGRCRR